MKHRLPQLIILISGAVLIGVGIVAICLQMLTQFMHGDFGSGLSSLKAFPAQFEVSTSYVGIELVIIGAVLEMVGYMGTGPWKRPPNST
jgi:uncharacterized membrane protein YecN with MAPEG domain